VTHPIAARLASPDAETRRAACVAAGEDPAGTLLAPALGRALGDPSKAVVRAASDALAAIARRAGGVDDILRAALHGDSPAARWGAAFTLARLGPPGPRLLPALVEALASPDGDVRWAASRILVDIGRLHGEVLPLVVGLVRSGESPVVRRMAAYALRSLAPDRPEAARVLLEATFDPDLPLRRAALTALAAVEAPPPEIPERLIEVLARDADAASRRLAALALGELGAAAPGSLPAAAQAALREALHATRDTDLRRAAERSLRKLEAESASPEGAP
jgi:HEAT repeat protein